MVTPDLAGVFKLEEKAGQIIVELTYLSMPV